MPKCPQRRRESGKRSAAWWWWALGASAVALFALVTYWAVADVMRPRRRSSQTVDQNAEHSAELRHDPGPKLRVRPVDEHVRGNIAVDQLKADVDAILAAGPRVAGSYSHGHNFTRDLLTSRLESLGLEVETDTFTQNTVLGRRTFINVIGTWYPAELLEDPQVDPRAGPWLILAAHLDSKLFDFHFVGATDSVASCGMLLDIAFNLTQNASLWIASRNAPVVKFVFFDGEEAFKEWTRTDSIYGARHLAKKWQRERVLSRIEVFVLLDLIGAADGQYISWFPDTHGYHLQLADSEAAFRSQGLLKRDHKYFHKSYYQAGIEDDHTPFLERGVPILHLIPYPFPREWHKPGDTGEFLDWDTIYDMTLLVKHFVEHYVAHPTTRRTRA